MEIKILNKTFLVPVIRAENLKLQRIIQLFSVILIFSGLCDISRAETTQNILWEGSLQPTRFVSSWALAHATIGGSYNLELIQSDSPAGNALRVHFSAGTYDPGSMTRMGKQIGGAGFVTAVGVVPQDSMNLRYYVKFPLGFNFVKGGKLPGLFGGRANTGGAIPNGADGFTTRYMWREGGAGEIYAYLPSSVVYGSSIGKYAWRFVPGRWTLIEQGLKMNTPGQRDGWIKVWVDEKLVVDQRDVVFRSVDSLKVQGIIFSTFFGGNDPSWATPVDTYVDFANFAISSGNYIGAANEGIK